MYCVSSLMTSNSNVWECFLFGVWRTLPHFHASKLFFGTSWNAFVAVHAGYVTDLCACFSNTKLFRETKKMSVYIGRSVLLLILGGDFEVWRRQDSSPWFHRFLLRVFPVWCLKQQFATKAPMFFLAWSVCWWFATCGQWMQTGKSVHVAMMQKWFDLEQNKNKQTNNPMSPNRVCPFGVETHCVLSLTDIESSRQWNEALIFGTNLSATRTMRVGDGVGAEHFP